MGLESKSSGLARVIVPSLFECIAMGFGLSTALDNTFTGSSEALLTPGWNTPSLGTPEQ